MIDQKAGLKVLSIGSDRKLFEDGSRVGERIKEYGNLVGELHIVVFALSSLGLSEKQLAPNVWVYPTNSVSKLFYVHDAARLGKKIVREKQFVRGLSVITAQDPFESGWAALKVKHKWRLPLEVQLHTDPFSPYFSGLLNAVRKIIANKVLRHADSIRVVTESLKAEILNIVPNASITVLPIFVDKKKIEETQVNFDLHARYPWSFTVLAVSRLSPEKNLPLALEALKLVREKFPSAGLLIIGSGSEEKSLRAKAKSLKMEAGVQFLGWQNELTSFYKTANVFIQTSVYEGYGLSLIEAGLSGLPVITTPVGIAQELEHGRDAYIYPPDRADLFAEGIKDLLENNFKRDNLKINMRRTLESKLLSKEAYLSEIKNGWEKTSKKAK